MSEKLINRMTINLTDSDMKGLNKIITDYLGFDLEPSVVARIFTRATAEKVMDGTFSMQELLRNHKQRSIQAGGVN